MAGFLALTGVAVAVSRAVAGANRAPLVVEVSAQVAAAGAVLVGRRTRPGPALVVVGVLSWLSPTPSALVAAFDVGRLDPRRAGTVWAVGGAVAAALTGRFALGRADAAWAVLAALLVLGAWLAGRARGAERQLAEAARREAARAQARLVGETRDAERARLAREMHDVVAHRVSYLVLQANVLETRLTDPERVADVRALRDTGRQALDEMRQVLALLREDGTPEGDRSAFSDLPLVLDEARAVGQPVTARVDVGPGDVPEVVERTAVRVVGEALTNAVRHAPGAPTRVALVVEDGALRVTVQNAAPPGTTAPVPGGGNGLRGVAERVALVGGTVTAGPDGDGGWAVEARLPREETA